MPKCFLICGRNISVLAIIACSDNLTGMSDAIASVYPKTEHQICIVHQIRNSLKYVSYKDRKQLAADLKALSHQLCKFREPLNSTIKFDHKMSHSFIPIGDRHRPFFESFAMIV
uniref:transposase n=1 Tax=Rickettsia endosymbiont of Urophora cardui TaxID=3066265 RepID=UPI00397B2A1E